MVNNPAQAVPGRVYSHEEELARWRREYLEIRRLIKQELDGLAEPVEGRTAEQQAGGIERRAEPRYKFMPESKIYAHMGPRAFPILNISIGGLAFHSDMYFEPGTKLLMSALGMIALDVEVLSCDMEETDADLLECKYRVRAKFGSHVNGYQVYVLAREMHLQNVKEKQGGEPLNLNPKG
ncbi:MAG TPA: PilZ domain-containing protein [bacterium]|nr:PilZ domain-containing protein [bacterium]